MPKELHQCLKFFVDFGPAFMSTVTEQYKRIQQCIRILIRYGFFIKLSDFYNNHDNDITIVRMHNPEVAAVTDGAIHVRVCEIEREIVSDEQ